MKSTSIRSNSAKRKKLAVLIAFLIIAATAFYYFNKDSGGAKVVSDNPIVQRYNLLSNPTSQKLYYAQSEGLTKEVDPRLIELDELTIGCFGSDYVLSMNDNDKSLGGQCCGVLKSTHMYEEQLKALERYKEIPEIPKDPYNVPVALAKKLIKFDQDIELTFEQQKMFDKASDMSNEKGPCCCKCWKWYAYSGLAKFLIVEHNFDAEQVAMVWDISDSCGEHGEHHSGVLKHGVHLN